MTTEQAKAILAAIDTQIRAAGESVGVEGLKDKEKQKVLDELGELWGRANKIESELRDQAAAPPPKAICLTDDSGRVIVVVDREHEQHERMDNAWGIYTFPDMAPIYPLRHAVYIGRDNALAAARRIFDDESAKQAERAKKAAQAKDTDACRQNPDPWNPDEQGGKA